MTENLVNSYFECLFDPERREKIAYVVMQSLESLPKDQSEELVSSLVQSSIKMIESGNVDVYTEIWIYSFMIQIEKNKVHLKKMIDRLKASEGVSWQQKVFLFWQIHTYLFSTPDVSDEDTLVWNWEYLEVITRIAKKDFSLPSIIMNKDELNNEYAVVIVEQFLSEKHGPTKTVLDRCAVLQKELGKKVILINTAECLSMTGFLPYFRCFAGSYIEELLNNDTVEWKGERIAFYQCNKNMPDYTEIRQVLNMILNIKPATVVLVGGPSILASFVNEYIPVLSVGLTQSGIIPSMASFMAVEDRLLDKCGSIVERMGRDKTSLIPGRFTFSLKPQTETHTREEFGIGEDEYVIAIVGGRLNEEITGSFIEMFENIAFDKMRILIIGNFTRIHELKDKYPDFIEHALYLGLRDDVLSVLELCDIYVNPHRQGGATSAVEAMFKGKPVVTTDFGDVRGVVDEEFAYSSYNDMEKAIMDLYNDKGLYERQSTHARELAAIDMDSAYEFKKLLQEYDRLKLSKLKA